jgi:hypothetical protein
MNGLPAALVQDQVIYRDGYEQGRRDAERELWFPAFVEGYCAHAADVQDGRVQGPDLAARERNKLWAEYNTPAPVQFPQPLREAS